MNIETVKVPVSQLAIGMQVVKLDRSWLETPFKLQGFRIDTTAELRTLEKYCRFVYVDVERSTGRRKIAGERVVLDERGNVVPVSGSAPGHAASSKRHSGWRGRRVSSEAKHASLPRPAVDYPVSATLRDELPFALAATASTKAAVRECVGELRHGGRANLGIVRQCAGSLEASMLRNPDAAMLIRTLQTAEPFSFRHCVNSAVLGIAIARSLGFRQARIHELTMGVLLADIGKMRLPKELLQASRRLDAHEVEIMQLHVRYGLEMSASLSGLSAGSLDVIAAHHERFNGSGYPAGLQGGEIPLLGRIAGLVDSFDAITSERGYAGPIPVGEAIKEMYAATVDVFQRDLVERLIQVLGTYPVGSMVELSDGSIALVATLNRERQLLPQVIVLTDTNRRASDQRRLVDLAAKSGPDLTIRDIIDPDECGVPRPSVSVISL